jgi:Uma2 family endonuclease
VIYAPPRRKLTVDEYHRMAMDGILGPDERVELLDGELYEMTPIGDDHAGAVNGLNFTFGARLGGKAIVAVQNPVRLSYFSEPEPDISLLRPRPDFYRSGKPLPQDIFLLIEVASSSLEYDRDTKIPRYAAAGILEVWIVNLVDGQIEVYRAPERGRYTLHTIYRRGESFAPLAFPDLVVRVEEILG